MPYLGLHPRLIAAPPRFVYERVHVVRASVAERLVRAAEALAPGYTLAILEGWRPAHIQRRMYLRTWNYFRERHPEWSDTQLRRVVNRFTAPPTHPRVPPPHATGGAVDVFLADAEGRELDMRSPYEPFEPRSAPFDAPNLTPTARRHRDLVAEAMLAAGITNYPSEYWHWSYGDQGWAYRGGHATALYGPTAPPGYQVPADDDTDAPLLRVEEISN